jgi:hypothetical protein
MAVAKLFSAGARPDQRRAEAWLKDRLSRGQADVFTETVDLTPALAEMLLARNPENRALSDRTSDTYARDIVEGRWKLNGEAIKVSRCGKLNDGQHRCSAVIKAGRSVRTLIVFGCERETRLTLDQGKARTPGDYLSMEGVTNANQIAAAAGNLWQYERFGDLSRSPEKRPTKSQTRDVFHRHPGLADSLKIIPRKGSGRLASLGLLAFSHYVFAMRSKPMADEFIARLVLGDGLELDDPIWRARDTLMTGKSSMDIGSRAKVIFKAWEKYRKGERAQYLRPGNATLRDLA